MSAFLIDVQLHGNLVVSECLGDDQSAVAIGVVGCLEHEEGRRLLRYGQFGSQRVMLPLVHIGGVDERSKVGAGRLCVCFIGGCVAGQLESGGSSGGQTCPCREAHHAHLLAWVLGSGNAYGPLHVLQSTFAVVRHTVA